MVDIKILLSLKNFKDLDDIALVDIAEHATLSEYKTDDRLIAEEVSADTLFLLEGALDLQGTGGVSQAMSAETDRALDPIFYTDTRGHYGRCTADCTVLKVNKEVERKYGIKHNRGKDNLNLEVFDTLPAVDSSLSLINEITQQFKSKSVTLPTLPEIVLSICAVLEKTDIEENELVQVVQIDPVIAARIIQVANSETYKNESTCDSIPKALARIGMEGLHTIVKGVQLRDLFKPDSELVQKQMIHFYEHSIRVAAICSDFAKRLPGFDPDHAFLAGLLHDIGVVPIMVVADDHTDLSHKTSNLDTALSQLKSYIGSMILQQWGFADEYSVTAKHAYDWKRKNDKGDYCDLVQVALMHAHLVGGEKINGPALNVLPAFKRLRLDKVNPVETAKSFQELAPQIKEMISLISL